MKTLRRFRQSSAHMCTLWIALCFFLTSAAYMSWVYRLMALLGGEATDWLSMGAGYLAQAAGLGLTTLALNKRPEADHRRWFTLALPAFALCAIPALLGGTAPGVVVFGLLMNLLCGVIAGYYLFALAAMVPASRRSVAFGVGYGIATIALGLLALVVSGDFLRGGGALWAYVPLALALALWAGRLPAPRCTDSVEPQKPLAKRELVMACATALLLSLIKNLGFGFPTVDIEMGLKPELSRLLYAVGLIAAGFINDKSRKNGAVCTAAALALPFIMLGLAGEALSSAICWGLDYLFFGFFSVYRAVLFLDIAARTRRWELAPVGLLFGRLGDASGTALCKLLTDSKIALVALTAALFMVAVFLFFRLIQLIYEPAAARQKSEREVFEGFAMQHDLSVREQEVLRLVLARRSNGEIAEALFVSASTVKFHMHNLLQKTGCKNRNDLLRKYAAALYPHMEGVEVPPIPSNEPQPADATGM